MENKKRLIFIEGLPGSGKTTLLTYFALLLPDTFTIRANYAIKIPNYIKLEPQDLETAMNEKTLIALDEGYTWLESRIAMNPLNRYMTYKLFQSRKRQLYFIVTAQIRGSIDNRFREMAQIIIKCKETNVGFQYKVYHVVEKKGRRILKKRNTFTLPFAKAEIIYPFFDTYEVVESQTIKDTFVKVMSMEEKTRRADEYANTLVIEKKEWSLDAVKAYLWRKGISLEYAKDVYYSIKAMNLGIDTSNETTKEDLKKKAKKIANDLIALKSSWSLEAIKAYLFEKELSAQLAKPIYYRIRYMQLNLGRKRKGGVVIALPKKKKKAKAKKKEKKVKKNKLKSDLDEIINPFIDDRLLKKS